MCRRAAAGPPHNSPSATCSPAFPAAAPWKTCCSTTTTSTVSVQALHAARACIGKGITSCVHRQHRVLAHILPAGCCALACHMPVLLAALCRHTANRMGCWQLLCKPFDIVSLPRRLPALSMRAVLVVQGWHGLAPSLPLESLMPHAMPILLSHCRDLSSNRLTGRSGCCSACRRLHIAAGQPGRQPGRAQGTPRVRCPLHPRLPCSPPAGTLPDSWASGSDAFPILQVM